MNESPNIKPKRGRVSLGMAIDSLLAIDEEIPSGALGWTEEQCEIVYMWAARVFMCQYANPGIIVGEPPKFLAVRGRGEQ